MNSQGSDCPVMTMDVWGVNGEYLDVWGVNGEYLDVWGLMVGRE